MEEGPAHCERDSKPESSGSQASRGRGALQSLPGAGLAKQECQTTTERGRAHRKETEPGSESPCLRPRSPILTASPDFEVSASTSDQRSIPQLLDMLQPQPITLQVSNRLRHSVDVTPTRPSLRRSNPERQRHPAARAPPAALRGPPAPGPHRSTELALQHSNVCPGRTNLKTGKTKGRTAYVTQYSKSE